MKWKIGLVLVLVLSILTVSFSGCVETEPTPTPTLTSITVTPVTARLNVTENITFRASPVPANATIGNVTWVVANRTVGTITPAGVFTARAVGATNITATFRGITETVRVTVLPTPTPKPTPTPTPTPTPVTPTPTPTSTPVTPTVRDMREFTISPATRFPGTIIYRHYEWRYGGVKWTWNLSLPESLYKYYRDKPRPPTHDYSVYVTDPYDDAYIEMLVEKFNAIAAKQGYTKRETVNFVIAFVQSLPYTVDNITTPFDEYPRYPIETLVDGGGDCEDTSILTAALLDKMGYDIVLIRLPGHIAVGVLGGEGIYGTHYLKNGKKYFYLETTGKGWKIGEMPNEYKGSPARLYHLVPRPIVTHNWTANWTVTYTGGIRNCILTVNVKNVGTATANNVYVYAAFDAGGNYVYSPVKSKTFSLVPGGSVIITLFLDIPRGVSTRLIVQIISDNYLMDNSTSRWFQT